MISRREDGVLVYRLRVPQRGDGKLLAMPSRWRSRTLFSLAEAMFEFEQATKIRPEYQLRVGLEPQVIQLGLAETLERILKRLISYTLLLDVDVYVYGEKAEGLQEADPSYTALEGAEACLLFSGGVDSLGGALWARGEHLKCVAVFCAHQMQSRVVSIVRTLKETLLRPLSIQLVEIPGPSLAARGYSQLRGFFYTLSAAAVAASIGAHRVVVSESGPTMFQPRFGAADQITTTTHPFVIDRARDVLEIVCDRGVTIETPFENKTKAEVMALCSNEKALRITHSCVSQRLMLHDGTCFGCVIRRLAGLATSALDTQYARNPLSDSGANLGNLLALLDFCAGVLIDRQGLPGYQTELIDDFNKWDLFERFALDNFGALHSLSQAGSRLVRPVEALPGCEGRNWSPSA